MGVTNSPQIKDKIMIFSNVAAGNVVVKTPTGHRHLVLDVPDNVLINCVNLDTMKGDFISADISVNIVGTMSIKIISPYIDFQPMAARYDS